MQPCIFYGSIQNKFRICTLNPCSSRSFQQDELYKGNSTMEPVPRGSTSSFMKIIIHCLHVVPEEMHQLNGGGESLATTMVLISKVWLEKCCWGHELIAYKLELPLRLFPLPIIDSMLPFSPLFKIGSTHQIQCRKKKASKKTKETASSKLFHIRIPNYIILEPMHRYRSSEIFPKSTFLFLYVSNHYHQLNILKSYILEVYS